MCCFTDNVDIPASSSQALTTSQGRSLPSGSPRGHVRSYSDVTPSVGEDMPDKRETQHLDKKSVKTILSHLLPTSTVMAPIQVPTSSMLHHNKIIIANIRVEAFPALVVNNNFTGYINQGGER